MNLVVAFAGQIGSGKSSVTRELSSRLEWKRVAFGEYLRAELTYRGKDADDRKALQDLGQSLVEADAEAFCRAVLSFGEYRPGESLLVDGVRHVSIYQVIGRIVAPVTTRLIFLAATQEIRSQRVSERPDGVSDFDRAEQHKVESDLIQDLPSASDVMLDATHNFDQIVRQCTDKISGWQHPPPS